MWALFGAGRCIAGGSKTAAGTLGFWSLEVRPTGLALRSARDSESPCRSGCFYELGSFSCGVLKTRALSFGVYNRAPDFLNCNLQAPATAWSTDLGLFCILPKVFCKLSTEVGNPKTPPVVPLVCPGCSIKILTCRCEPLGQEHTTSNFAPSLASGAGHVCGPFPTQESGSSKVTLGLPIL